MAESEPSSPVDQVESLESLERKVVGISSRMEEFEQLLGQARKLRWLTAGGILIVILIIIGLFARSVMLIDREQVLAIAHERSPRILDDIRAEFRRGLEQVYPEVKQKLDKKVAEHAPKIMETAKDELDVLVSNLNKGIQAQVEEEVGALEERITAALKKEFPELTQEKVNQMVKNFEEAIKKICEEFAHEYLEEHASLLVGIERTIMAEGAFEPVEGEEVPSGEELAKELRATAEKLLTAKFLKVADLETAKE